MRWSAPLEWTKRRQVSWSLNQNMDLMTILQVLGSERSGDEQDTADIDM